MQNKYVADVGDFGKYGLLRALTEPGYGSDRQFKLGVNWYLVPDESHNNDGKYIGYLEKSDVNDVKFRACDPYLYDSLQFLIKYRSRDIQEVIDLQILPEGTEYFSAPLSFADILGTTRRETARYIRSNWLDRAFRTLAKTELVFVDPDNGLDTRTRPEDRGGPKYVFYDELKPYANAGQSLVIYHHLARQKKGMQQIEDRAANLQQHLNRPVLAMWYHRGTARAFFVVPAADHYDDLRQKLMEFSRSKWSQHFDLVDFSRFYFTPDELSC